MVVDFWSLGSIKKSKIAIFYEGEEFLLEISYAHVGSILGLGSIKQTTKLSSSDYGQKISAWYLESV